VPAGAPALAGSPLAALGTLPIPPFVPADAPTSANPSDIPHIPGGGLTRRLLAALAAPSPAAGAPPTAALLQFVLEGDNRGDAAALATAAAHAAGAVALLPRGGWAEPPSWRTGLFGGAVDGVLYS
jgi:proteasome assembly chaperone 2